MKNFYIENYETLVIVFLYSFLQLSESYHWI